MLLGRILTLIFLVMSSASSGAESHSCLISVDKKELIESVLCGQAAKEPEYQQFGPGCFKRSIEKRLEDSAAQIYMYKLCGDTKFSNEMLEGNVRALEFMELLAPCVSESVDIRAVMDDRYQFVERKAAGLTCTSDTRALLSQRRAFFEGLIAQSQDESLVIKILSRLRIRLDDQGNLVDD
ncbi:hypothetical protein NKJ06_12270 [Mesorhizobium sp. M0293]|uniref:hypothetical protein n=1 Tax=unclassified Mesorhizobium TaxID=325217 RepID=UPI0033390747